MAGVKRGRGKGRGDLVSRPNPFSLPFQMPATQAKYLGYDFQWTIEIITFPPIITPFFEEIWYLQWNHSTLCLFNSLWCIQRGCHLAQCPQTFNKPTACYPWTQAPRCWWQWKSKVPVQERCRHRLLHLNHSGQSWSHRWSRAVDVWGGAFYKLWY